MNRTTKAMARLGTLAVIATTALGTPLAIGTAFANAGTLAVGTTPGTVTQPAAYPGPGTGTPATVTTSGLSAVAGATLTLGLTGSAYFNTSNPVSTPNFTITYTPNRNGLTCTVVIAGSSCNVTWSISDPVAEPVTVSATAGGGDTISPASVVVSFTAPAGVTATAANIVNGAATTVGNASSGLAGNAPGQFTLTGGNPGDQVQIQLNGTNAYFTTTAGQNAGRTSGQTVTCNLTAGTTPCGAAGNNTFILGDAFPEAATVTVKDITTPSANPAVGFSQFTVNFNSIYFTTCGTSSGPTPPGIQTGAAVVNGSNQCVSQLQEGVVSTQTVAYKYAGVLTGGQNLLATISGGASVQFSASTATAPYSIVAGTGNKEATCTTAAADGTCSFNVVDNNAADVTTPPAAPLQVTLTVQLNGPATGYNVGALATQFCDITTNPLPAAPFTTACPNAVSVTAGAPSIAGGPPADAGALPAPNANAAVEAITVGGAPTPPSRVNLISAKLIAPTSQTAANSPAAEPGDAIQLQYQLLGSCTPTAGAFQNCDNTGGSTPAAVPDAGIPLTLSVDHGFFTPNCAVPNTTQGNPIPAGSNNYANCSFSTAPAANGAVGNLTSSGTTMNVTSDSGGFFTVTLGIGRDTAFDNNGIVVAHVTAATTAAAGSTASTLPPLQIGPLPVSGPASTCPTGGEAIQPLVGGGNQIIRGSDQTVVGGGVAGCQEDVAWSTKEVPLNGGKASLVAIKPLSSPGNVSINTENNFDANDTGTVNVPDQGRVVFVVHALDQFGNLTSDIAPGGGGGTPNNLWLTKTGPGQLWKCLPGGGSPTDACPGPVAGIPTAGVGTTQADGTTTQVDKAVVGSYVNAPAQQRYQADTFPFGAFGGNDGFTTVTPSVNDGTTTVVLSWTPPTTQFKTFLPAVGLAGAVASYQTGNGAAETDTFTLNFYNQLAQPVVTFTVVPGNKVPTSTGVTVTATVLDQFKNPLVGVLVDALRSGANEASCVPIQNVANGGAAGNQLVTNTSGQASYTFSCNRPGVSTVTMVVHGFGAVGGSQPSLARGVEAITFTGAGTHRTVERPTVTLTSFHRHHLTVNIATDPAIRAGHTVNVYRLINGVKHLVGQTHTGPRGNATLTFRGLRSHRVWTVAVKVIDLGRQYRSEYSIAVSHRVR